MEDRRTPWPVLIVACAVTAAAGVAVATLAAPKPATQTDYQLVVPAATQPPFDLRSAAPALNRGGPPGKLARDNAEYPVGNGPTDELLPGRWAAIPPGTDCKWVVQYPHSTDFMAGSTETHWKPGTAIYVQLDAKTRFQTVNCGTWFLDSPLPSSSPRVR
jgi:hypothetical protein